MNANEMENKLFMLEKRYHEDPEFKELVDMITAKVIRILQEAQENDRHG